MFVLLPDQEYLDRYLATLSQEDMLAVQYHFPDTVSCSQEC